MVAGTSCGPAQIEAALQQLIKTLLMTFGFCLLVDGFLYIKFLKKFISAFRVSLASWKKNDLNVV